MRRLTLALAAALACLAACHAPSEPSPLASAAAPISPPSAWRTATPYAFEQLALAWPPPADPPAPLTDPALDDLTAALSSQDELAVRAAVLLARSADPRAGLALLSRLELRTPTEPPDGTRHGDAADVVAAAALHDWIVAPDQPERLARLALGPDPFPDLEVRVECAAGALHQGRDEVIPWLLRVLRSMTPDEALAGIDWPAKRTVAWAKHRAAEALAARAGVASTFRPDGSYDHQKAETDRLAALLGASAP